MPICMQKGCKKILNTVAFTRQYLLTFCVMTCHSVPARKDFFSTRKIKKAGKPLWQRLSGLFDNVGLRRTADQFGAVPPRFFLKKASISPYTWRWLVRPEMPCLAPG